MATDGGLRGVFVWRADIRGAVTVSGMLAPFALPAFAVLAGLATFSADHRARSFHQFAERGISAGNVWLSRQFFWLSQLVVLTALLGLLPAQQDGISKYPFDRVNGSEDWIFGVLCLAIFGVAEIVSIAVSRWILALILVPAFFAAVSAFVSFLYDYKLHSDWAVTWFFAALSLWSSFGSLYFVRHRIRRCAGKTVARWQHPIAVLTFLVPLMPVSFAVARAYEIPWIDSGAEVVAVPIKLRPDQEATVRAYQRALFETEYNGYALAWYSPDTVNPERISVSPIHELIPELRELESTADFNQFTVGIIRHLKVADELPDVPGLFDRLDRGNIPPTLLIDALRIRGNELMWELQLDRAWEHYELALRLIRRFLNSTSDRDAVVRIAHKEIKLLADLRRWGAQKGQTRERIRLAFDTIRRHNQETDWRANVFRQIHHRAVAALEGTIELDVPFNMLRFQYPLHFSVYEGSGSGRIAPRWMFWERCRQRRFLNHRTRLALSYCDFKFADFVANPRQRQWEGTTQTPDDYDWRTHNLRSDQLHESRYSRLCLALCLYRHELGELPMRIEHLALVGFDDVVQEYLDFRFPWYFPHGIKRTTRSTQTQEVFSLEETPFVWIPVPPFDTVHDQSDESAIDEYQFHLGEVIVIPEMPAQIGVAAASETFEPRFAVAKMVTRLEDKVIALHVTLGHVLSFLAPYIEGDASSHSDR